MKAGREIPHGWPWRTDEWHVTSEKHWHGATPTTAMTHIAIQENLDGKAVEWTEKVTDEEYKKWRKIRSQRSEIRNQDRLGDLRDLCG